MSEVIALVVLAVGGGLVACGLLLYLLRELKSTAAYYRGRSVYYQSRYDNLRDQLLARYIDACEEEEGGDDEGDQPDDPADYWKHGKGNPEDN